MSVAIKLTPATRQTSIEFDPSTLKAVALVGQVVTWSGNQYKVHSVEGTDFYAFETTDGTIMLDFNLTPIERSTVATIIPMGSKIGDGLGIEVHVFSLVRGVCLGKSWA